jgi:mRNA interferase MazF
LKRGDLLPVIVAGDHGKPRPAVVIQTDTAGDLDTVIVCLITSDFSLPKPFRVDLSVTPENGLRKPSQIMADKMFTQYRARCGEVFGNIGLDELLELNRAIAIITGLAD